MLPASVQNTFKNIRNSNPSILGNSWNLNSCITEGLIHSKTYTVKTGIPRKSPHYRIGIPLFTFDEDLHDDE